MQVVNLDQGHAGAAVFPAHNRGVIARSERSDDGGFGVIRGGEAGRLNERLLLLPPVIVAADDRAIAVVQIQRRIGQRIGDPGIGQRRTDRPNDDGVAPAVADNKTAD